MKKVLKVSLPENVLTDICFGELELLLESGKKNGLKFEGASAKLSLTEDLVEEFDSDNLVLVFCHDEPYNSIDILDNLDADDYNELLGNLQGKSEVGCFIVGDV
ncbi:MAG: hypothetical protein QXD03_02650 [Candidatus Anstonellales archaeon]